ncbi:MAG: coiled-coil domain-containing protein [Parachlamydiaceae bacterium]
MNNVRIITASVSDSVSYYTQKGLDMMGHLAKVISTTTPQITQHHGAIFTIFAVSNLALIILSSRLTDDDCRSSNNHSTGLSQRVKNLKRLFLNGAFCGAVFGLNIGISNYIEFPLKKGALITLSITVIGLSILLHRFPRRTTQQIEDKNGAADRPLDDPKDDEHLVEIESLKKTIIEKEQLISSQEKEIKTLSNKNKQLMKQVSQMQRDLEDSQGRVKQKEMMLTANKQYLTKLESEKGQLEKLNDELHDRVADIKQSVLKLNNEKDELEKLNQQLTNEIKTLKENHSNEKN